MNHTASSALDILISMLRRHARACEAGGRTDVKHDLGNVQEEGDAVAIATTTGQHVRLTGSVLAVDGIEMPLEGIQQIEWIAQDANEAEPAESKRDHFDRMKVNYRGQWVAIDGLGQSVFPVLQFLKWAIKERGIAD